METLLGMPLKRDCQTNLVLEGADDGEEALRRDGHHGQGGDSDRHVAKGPEKETIIRSGFP